MQQVRFSCSRHIQTGHHRDNARIQSSTNLFTTQARQDAAAAEVSIAITLTVYLPHWSSLKGPIGCVTMTPPSTHAFVALYDIGPAAPGSFSSDPSMSPYVTSAQDPADPAALALLLADGKLNIVALDMAVDPSERSTSTWTFPVPPELMKAEYVHVVDALGSSCIAPHAAATSGTAPLLTTPELPVISGWTITADMLICDAVGFVIVTIPDRIPVTVSTFTQLIFHCSAPESL
jgi:hypothetical protein